MGLSFSCSLEAKGSELLPCSDHLGGHSIFGCFSKAHEPSFLRKIFSRNSNHGLVANCEFQALALLIESESSRPELKCGTKFFEGLESKNYT